MLFITTFVASVLTVLGTLYLSKKWQFGIDSQLKGAQKFHTVPTPRTGGIAIFLSIGVGCFLFAEPPALLLWLAGFVAFIGGIAEDLTGKINPFWRLILTFVAAAIAFYLVDAGLQRVGVIGFNELFMASTIASLIFTVFAVGGVAHSVNIVDGYNGLMLGFCLMAMSVFGGLAWHLDDILLLQLCVMGAAATLGLLLFNCPTGKIFCGDGGAYFLGFWLAEIAVLLIVRHDEISPWLGFLVMAYPVVETLFSMYRKKVLRKMSPSLPDRVHLHMLIYQRVIRPMWRHSNMPKNLQNAMVSPFLWVLAAIPALVGVWLRENTALLLIALLGFVLLYLGIYWRLVAFGVRQKRRV